MDEVMKQTNNIEKRWQWKFGSETSFRIAQCYLQEFFRRYKYIQYLCQERIAEAGC